MPTEIIKVSRLGSEITPASDLSFLTHIVVPRGYRAILIRMRSWIQIVPDNIISASNAPELAIYILNDFVTAGIGHTPIAAGLLIEEHTGQTKLIYWDDIGIRVSNALTTEHEIMAFLNSRQSDDFIDEEKVGGGNSIQAWTIAVHMETETNDTHVYRYWFSAEYMLEWMDTGRSGSKLPDSSAQLLIGGLA